MKSTHTLAAWSLAAVLAGLAPQTLAGDGHDHGEAPATTAGPALPRFTAVSELFELVGVVNGKNVTVYLDHFADNSPVKDAKVDLELDGKAVALAPHADGEFEALASDDDGLAEGTDSRLNFTLPSDGNYVVRAMPLQ